MATDVLRSVTSPVLQRIDDTCAHCSLPVPEGLIDTTAEKQFCCAGCRTAFSILNDHGLGRYYGLADRRQMPVTASGRGFEEFDHPAFAERYVTHRNGLAR